MLTLKLGRDFYLNILILLFMIFVFLIYNKVFLILLMIRIHQIINPILIVNSFLI